MKTFVLNGKAHRFGESRLSGERFASFGAWSSTQVFAEGHGNARLLRPAKSERRMVRKAALVEGRELKSNILRLQRTAELKRNVFGDRLLLARHHRTGETAKR